MSQKTFFFRVDASPVIGTGHVVRCLNLARQLTRKGAEVVFLSRGLPENFRRQIDQIGCALVELTQYEDVLPQNPSSYETWLGCSQIEDAKECEALIGEQKEIILIVDHYGVAETWIDIIKPLVGGLVFFDDLAQRSLNVDWVINQNIGWEESDYHGLVNAETRLLIGPGFAALSDTYANMSKSFVRYYDPTGILRILISLGGADAHNVSKQIASVLCKLNLKREFKITIVAGHMNPNLQELQQFCGSQKGKVSLVTGANDLAEIYAEHDIAIGAVGSSSWERCCLGLPSILVAIADNQIPAAKELHRLGAGYYLENFNENLEEKLGRQIVFLEDANNWQKMSEIAAGICDGRGSQRIANILF